MSGARRAYDLIRGYVSHGWDQLSHDEQQEAGEELRKAIDNPVASKVGQAPGNSAVQEPEQPITLEQARNLFGVSASATSKQITESYDALRSNVDLSKFVEGSDAWRRARKVGRRLDAARNLLMENIDPTVRRFEKLEIE